MDMKTCASPNHTNHKHTMSYPLISGSVCNFFFLGGGGGGGGGVIYCLYNTDGNTYQVSMHSLPRLYIMQG